MKLTLTILTIVLSSITYSQKFYKGTISISPDMLFANKHYIQRQYFGGTVELLGNIKNISLGLGGNISGFHTESVIKMTAGYLTARQSLPIGKFVPYASAAIGYGQVKTDSDVSFKEKGAYYHAGGGLRYKALPYIEPFISARYSSYYNGKVWFTDDNSNLIGDKTIRVSGVSVSVGVNFNLL